MEDAITADPSARVRAATVLRTTYDQLYDGQRTGRYRPGELMKTEKTHMGTLVEINMQRAFDWADGVEMDYEIAGVEVDCKFSRRLGGWEIPNEARRAKHICLVMWADEEACRWEAGLVRVGEDPLYMRMGGKGNQDGKRRLTAEGESRVRWLFPTANLPSNQLLHLDPATQKAIFASRSGQARITELCRRVQHVIITRTTVLTVARQDDGLKRPRDARLHLRPEGIIVLGHQHHDPDVARSLGLPVPVKGEFVTARLVPADRSFGGPTAEIEGRDWRLAQPNDPVVPAPQLPR